MAAIDSLPVERKAAIISKASTQARLSRNSLNRNEDTAKDSLNKLYRSQVEWHRKVALPVSVIIFFLIGAPLGAIIRKGDRCSARCYYPSWWSGYAYGGVGALLCGLLHH